MLMQETCDRHLTWNHTQPRPRTTTTKAARTPISPGRHRPLVAAAQVLRNDHTLSPYTTHQYAMRMGSYPLGQRCRTKHSS